VNEQILEYLRRQIEDRRSELRVFIAGGTLKNFDEYNRLCGFIQGLNAVEQHINDLAKRLENNADD